jgi:hypothetical protein
LKLLSCIKRMTLSWKCASIINNSKIFNEHLILNFSNRCSTMSFAADSLWRISLIFSGKFRPISPSCKIGSRLRANKSELAYCHFNLVGFARGNSSTCPSSRHTFLINCRIQVDWFRALWTNKIFALIAPIDSFTVNDTVFCAHARQITMEFRKYG